MTRLARAVIEGVPHHVTQRGNRWHPVSPALRGTCHGRERDRPLPSPPCGLRRDKSAGGSNGIAPGSLPFAACPGVVGDEAGFPRLRCSLLASA